MSFSIGEQFMMARDEHQATVFLKKTPHVWVKDNTTVDFTDGSSAIPIGMDRKLSDREVTKAVARYCRRHGHYASFVRTNTEAMRDALREWRLDYYEAAS